MATKELTLKDTINGNPVIKTIPDLSRFKYYWDKPTATLTELLQVLSDSLINVPYEDDNKDNQRWCLTSPSDTENSFKVFRPNHGSLHCLRKFIYSVKLVEAVRAHGKDDFKQAVNSLSTEELAALQLACICSRMGRSNELSSKRDSSNSERSAELFIKIAKELGFDSSSIFKFKHFISEYIPPSQYNDDQKYYQYGIDSNASKYKLLKHILDISHNIDLVRCYGPNRNVTTEVIDNLKFLIEDPQVAKTVANKFRQYAIDLNKATGNKVLNQRPSTSYNYDLQSKQVKDLTVALDAIKDIKSPDSAIIKQEGPGVQIPESKPYPLKNDFLFKAIREDDDSYWPEWVSSVVFQEESALRPRARKDWTVRLDTPDPITGKRELEAVKLSDRESLFKNDIKKDYSKHQSTTFCSPTQEFQPNAFGSMVRPVLVGIRFDLNNALLQRIIIDDAGTFGRGYDHDTQQQAEQFIEHVKTNGKYFTSLAEMVKTYKNKNYHKDIEDNWNHNEIMARLRWAVDGSSQIVIFTDNIESRLLAQVRALDLSLALSEKYNKTMPVPPISFYKPLKYYTNEQQAHDLVTAKSDPNLIKYYRIIELIGQGQDFVDDYIRHATEQDIKDILDTAANLSNSLRNILLKKLFANEASKDKVMTLLRQVTMSSVQRFSKYYRTLCDIELDQPGFTYQISSPDSYTLQELGLIFKHMNFNNPNQKYLDSFIKEKIVSSAAFYHAIFHLIPNNKDQVINAAREIIPKITENNIDLANILLLLNSEQCQLVCELVHEKLPALIKNIDMLNEMLLMLNVSQRRVVFNIIKNYISLNDMVKTVDDLNKLLQVIECEQASEYCNDIKDEINNSINSKEDYNKAIKSLNKPKANVIYHIVKNKLTRFIDDHEDLTYILKLLNEDQCLDMLNMINGKLPQLVHNANKFKYIITNLNTSQRSAFYAAVGHKLREILKSSNNINQCFAGLDDTISGELLDNIKFFIPGLIKNANDFNNIFSVIDEVKRHEISKSLTDEYIVDLIKDSRDLYLVLSSLEQNRANKLFYHIIMKRDDLISDPQDMIGLLSILNPATIAATFHLYKDALLPLLNNISSIVNIFKYFNQQNRDELFSIYKDHIISNLMTSNPLEFKNTISLFNPDIQAGIIACIPHIHILDLITDYKSCSDILDIVDKDKFNSLYIAILENANTLDGNLNDFLSIVENAPEHSDQLILTNLTKILSKLNTLDELAAVLKLSSHDLSIRVLELVKPNIHKLQITAKNLNDILNLLDANKKSEVFNLVKSELAKNIDNFKQLAQALLVLSSEYGIELCKELAAKNPGFFNKNNILTDLLFKLDSKKCAALYIHLEKEYKISSKISTSCEFIVIYDELNPTQKDELFSSISLDLLSKTITNANFFAILFYRLSDTQKITLFNHLKNNIPPLVNCSVDLINIVIQLLPEQAEQALDVLQDKLNYVITQNKIYPSFLCQIENLEVFKILCLKTKQQLIKIVPNIDELVIFLKYFKDKTEQSKIIFDVLSDHILSLAESEDGIEQLFSILSGRREICDNQKNYLFYIIQFKIRDYILKLNSKDAVKYIHSICDSFGGEEYINRTIYNLTKDQIANKVNTGHQYWEIMCILMHLPKRKRDFYERMKYKIKGIIKCSKDYYDIAMHMTDALRHELYIEVKDIIPDLIKSSDDITNIFRFLVQDDLDDFYSKIEDSIPNLIKNFDDFGSLRYYLKAEQLIKIYDQIKADIPKLITMPHHIREILEVLKKPGGTRRQEFYLSIKPELPKLIKSFNDIGYILPCLEHDEAHDFCTEHKDLIFDKFEKIDDFISLLYIGPSLLPIIYNIVKPKIVHLVNSARNFEDCLRTINQNLKPEHRIEICNLLIHKLPGLCNTLNDFVNMLWFVTPENEHIVYCALKPKIKYIVNNELENLITILRRIPVGLMPEFCSLLAHDFAPLFNNPKNLAKLLSCYSLSDENLAIICKELATPINKITGTLTSLIEMLTNTSGDGFKKIFSAMPHHIRSLVKTDKDLALMLTSFREEYYENILIALSPDIPKIINDISKFNKIMRGLNTESQRIKAINILQIHCKFSRTELEKYGLTEILAEEQINQISISEEAELGITVVVSNKRDCIIAEIPSVNTSMKYQRCK